MKPTNGFSHVIKNAFADFKRNKVRTVLTSLGIMIGVLSVVLLIALGLGLKNYLKEQFESLGSNLIMLMPGNMFSDEAGAGAGMAGMAGGIQFDEKDYINLQKIKDADYVVPMFFKSMTLETTTGDSRIGYVMGSSEDMFPLMNYTMIAGRVLSKSDILRKTKNGVAGEAIAEQLFIDPEKSIGKTVKIGTERIKIVGVFENTGDREQDRSIIIPYTTSFKKLNPDKTFFSIYLGANDETMVESLKAKVETELLKRYEEDDFSVVEQTEILSTVNQIFSIVNGILVAIGSISLIVGGIGIMNIMYASVTERTKEVGIRRAVGATQKDILMQFLAESVILSFIGGFLGLALASLIVLAVRPFFPAAINLVAVLLAFGVSSGIGVFFGVFPAKRAAKLSPIEAIRYE
ncbi:ABC transporter permease [Patescibacteria group bacterium]